MAAYTLTAKPYPLLILVGPTSSGKSELAVKLAKKFNGEIISADSRQIYRGLDLGTGKVPGKHLNLVDKKCGRTFCQLFIYKNTPHHLIDFINPKRQYSAALFQRDAKKAIADILARGKLPIICGGTAHWIDAVVYDQQLPDVKPNSKLRANLKKQPIDVLFKQLLELDPARAKTIDRHNKHRLIRALEIVLVTGKPVPASGVILRSAADEGSLKPGIRDSSAALGMTPYNVLWLGINPPKPELHKKINLRLKQRIKAGMIKEVTNLHRNGLSWKRLESFGLEYKYISLYLQKKSSYNEMLAQLSFAIKHYAKRQMTWWKRNKDIRWLKLDEQSPTNIASKFLNAKL